MIDQSYTTNALLRLLTRADPKRYPLGRDRADYRTTLANVTEHITADDYNFSSFNKAIRNGKLVHIPSNLSDVFALRKLNNNLSKIYGIKQSDRHSIINQVITLLGEQVPFFVAKRDIKEFYESINRDALVKRINDEQNLCYRSRKHLHLLFEIDSFSGQRGLPRGLSVSATLSELFLAELDRYIRALPGIYYYARFVDDLIFFSYVPPDTFMPEIQNLLRDRLGLEFSAEKSKMSNLEFDKNRNCVSETKELSYLGYRFVFKEQPGSIGIFHTRVAVNKIKKIKRRIMLSIHSFIRDGDYNLLKDRIAFLSGNYRLKNDKDNRTLKAGIFYNYSLIDLSGREELKEISHFLNAAIYSKKGSIGKNLWPKLSHAQRAELGNFCFHAGFVKKIMRKFSSKRMGQINSCWKYA